MQSDTGPDLSLRVIKLPLRGNVTATAKTCASCKHMKRAGSWFALMPLCLIGPLFIMYAAVISHNMVFIVTALAASILFVVVFSVGCWRSSTRFAKCKRTPTRTSNVNRLVSGRGRTTTDDLSYCSTQREWFGACGTEAKLWEPKDKPSAN